MFGYYYVIKHDVCFNIYSINQGSDSEHPHVVSWIIHHRVWLLTWWCISTRNIMLFMYSLDVLKCDCWRDVSY